MRRAARLLGALVFLAVPGACRGGVARSTEAPPPNTAVAVDIRNVAFNPKTVTVHAGQTVAWKFDDGSIAHNVTGAGWASPDRTSGYYTHSFPSPGTYDYSCTIHSNMDGEVVVTP